MCYLSLRMNWATDNRRVRSVKSSAIFSASNKSNRNFLGLSIFMYQADSIKREREREHTHARILQERRERKKKSTKIKEEELLFALHQKVGGLRCV